MTDDSGLITALDAAHQLPRRVVTTYARLWQLETWLRQMVYVELSAKFGSGWKHEVAGSPTKSLTNDLHLTHMPTPEQFPVSYMEFSMLLKTVDNHWDLFEPYLPPQDLWQAKLAEVKQIRNRVAHFRRGHNDDLARVVRLMRDVDQGFFKFCTSYNDSQPILPPTRDPVVKKFLDLNQFQYTKVGQKNGQW